MAVVNSLRMAFSTEDNKKKTVELQNVRANVTASQVQTFAAAMVAAPCPFVWAPVVLVAAEVVTRDSQKITI